MADLHSGATKSVDAWLESALQSVDSAEDVVLQVAQEIGFEEDALHEIGMSVREAAVNAVVHGNRYNAQKKVHLEVWKSPDGMTIRISDEGGGFDRAEGLAVLCVSPGAHGGWRALRGKSITAISPFRFMTMSAST